jgi:hypothetical protein
MANFINTLVSSNLDSFTNLFDIEVTLPTGIGTAEDTTLLKVRAGDFQAPQPKLAQYTTDYQSIQLTRVAPMMELERKFDLTFRVDSNYNVYYFLKQWSLLYHDILEGGINLPSGAASAGDESSILGNIKVKALSPNTAVTALAWTFGKVICNKVTEPNYSRAGTEPVAVTASFIFFDYLPPGADAAQLQGTLTV